MDHAGYDGGDGRGRCEGDPQRVPDKAHRQLLDQPDQERAEDLPRGQSQEDPQRRDAVAFHGGVADRFACGIAVDPHDGQLVLFLAHIGAEQVQQDEAGDHHRQGAQQQNDQIEHCGKAVEQGLLLSGRGEGDKAADPLQLLPQRFRIRMAQVKQHGAGGQLRPQTFLRIGLFTDGQDPDIVFKDARIDANYIPYLEIELGFELRLVRGLQDTLCLSVSKRYRVLFRADKAGDTSSIAHNIPGTLIDNHVNQHISREDFMRNDFLLAVFLDFNFLFHRNHHVEDHLLHASGVDQALKVGLYFVLVAGIGMNHIPGPAGIVLVQVQLVLFCHA